jgi:hypothetical protein
MTRCPVLLLVLATLTLTPESTRAQAPLCSSLPANILVAAVYQAWVEALIARSPTLQRQCAAIAAASRVVVRVRPAGQLEVRWRAHTMFSRDRAGRLWAAVGIPVSIDFPELLAHELEHVVEQIEGLNLRRLSRVATSGVRQVGRNAFETIRAGDAGRSAAGEVLACVAADRVACGLPRVMQVAARD